MLKLYRGKWIMNLARFDQKGVHVTFNFYRGIFFWFKKKKKKHTRHVSSCNLLAMYEDKKTPASMMPWERRSSRNTTALLDRHTAMPKTLDRVTDRRNPRRRPSLRNTHKKKNHTEIRLQSNEHETSTSAISFTSRTMSRWRRIPESILSWSRCAEGEFSSSHRTPGSTATENKACRS